MQNLFTVQENSMGTSIAQMTVDTTLVYAGKSTTLTDQPFNVK